MEVLSRNPERGSINTAVSNLVTIYKRDDRFEDARNILEQYQRYLDHDKYHNHLVDILDKTKQYGQMIELLKEMIPNAGKSQAASHQTVDKLLYQNTECQRCASSLEDIQATY